ncbi:MAG: hypothetical protein AAFN74_22790 [Myxococcota bacterium]
MRRYIWLLLLSGVACVEETDPPSFGVFQVSGLIAEVEGFVLAGPPGMMQPTPGNLVLARGSFGGPTSLPTFIDSPTPPNCLANSIVPTKPPGGNATDGGNLVFTGLQPTPGGMYLDLSSQTPSELRATVTCVQGADPTASPGETGLRHVCDIPQTAFLGSPQTAFGDAAGITISATGGSQSGPFTSSPIAVPPVITATGTFNLNAIDPRQGITAQWIPTTAPLVLIEVIATRGEGAALTGAQILCLAPMPFGQQSIPQGALDLVPGPSATEPVSIITSIAAVNFEQSSEGWGTYLVGVGRGQFGLSVLLPGQ